jgi:hypothetical protein
MATETKLAGTLPEVSMARRMFHHDHPLHTGFVERLHQRLKLGKQ